VEHLKKRFGKTVALDGIDFEVGTSQTLGLLGPNGAGKTTTIKIMCGLLKPDAGTVTLDGKSDPGRMDVRMSLGMVPQSLAVYEELTAYENLQFFGRIYGLGGQRLKSRIDACLEIAGLASRSKDRVAHFSGGMKRRLNMVCSFLHDPPVLLLDEPTVGVDPQSRNLIFETIEGMKTQGKTILYTTHYMEEAQRLCDRVAIMDQGKIMAIGSVKELIAEHGGPSHIEAELTEAPANPDALRGYIDDPNAALDGVMVKFQTSEPMQALAKLNQSGLRFTTLQINTANLEDVFLNLTGRRLRDQ
jgi:ABC-2 type transport system ATP-binding protein